MVPPDLRQSEDLFLRVFHGSLDVMSITTVDDGRLVDVNAAFARVFGWERDEAVGRTVTELGVWVDAVTREAYVRELEELGAVAGFEVPLRIRSGEVRRMLVSSQLIDLGGQRCILAVTRDIGELARTEQALHRAEDSYRKLLEQIPAVPYTFESSSGSGSFGYVSPMGEALFGYSQDELARPVAWAEMLHPDDRARVLAESERTDRTGEPFDVEYRVITKDGRTVWVRDRAIVAERDEGGRARLWHGLFTDISDRRRAQEEHRRLLSRMIAAQEHQRERIAVDLQDDTLQKLSAARIRLQPLRKRIRSADEKVALDRLDHTVDLAIGRLRRLLRELRPPELDSQGLAETLRHYLEGAGHATGFRSHVEDRLAGEPSPEARIVAFRIVQDAVANVHRHARATWVEVELRTHAGGLGVRLADDGVGFEPREAARSGGLGLRSMRERAELSGGWCEIRSSRGSGTTVEMWLPDAAEPSSGTSGR